jgi:hypothetical protein
MRFVSFERGGRKALAAARHDEWRGLAESDDGFPGTLQMLIEAGGTALVTAGKALASAPKVQLDEVTLLPPISSGEKIICVGLNYKDHSSESGFKQPEYPTIFGRFNSSLIAHGAPILRPSFSEQLDYEGELAAIAKPRAMFRRPKLLTMSLGIQSSTTLPSGTISSRRRNGRRARTSTTPARSALILSRLMSCRQAALASDCRPDAMARSCKRRRSPTWCFLLPISSRSFRSSLR